MMSFDPQDDDIDELLVETESEDAEQTAATNEDEPVPAERASGAARKLEPVVLAHVLAPKYQPVKPRVIAKQLKLPSEQHRALKLAIRRLVKAGKLVYGAGHIVRAPRARSRESGVRSQETGDRRQGTRLPTPDSRSPTPSARSSNLVTGTFRRTSKGFGFVRPQGAQRGDRTGDIYIAASSTMDAADRDVVRVRLSRSKARGKGGALRQAGEIVEIVERDTHR